MPAGYSGTPLFKKLGMKPDFRICVKNEPANYRGLVSEMVDQAVFSTRLSGMFDLIHFFTSSRKEFEVQLPKLKNKIYQDGAIWISWPKKASKVETDMTENVIRDVCLPLGLVDVKVCAVDEIWSGLKLVIRKELRK